MFDVVWNRQPLLERHLDGETDRLDANGLKTGEKEKSYSRAKEIDANISPASGEYARNPFGSFKNYTHLIVSAEPLGIVEQSILYYETSVYIVRRVAHDLGTYLYALDAVNAGEYPPPKEIGFGETRFGLYKFGGVKVAD